MEVTLAPYFLSKYEMTQGQWLRIDGRTDPSQYGPGDRWTREDWALHPVERVRLDGVSRGTRCFVSGWSLPTEAQWEYGARGGTSTPWWTGSDVSHVARAGNVADQAYQRNYSANSIAHKWDDGFAAHAPVGSFLPNPFGLHDTIGNVWEWCFDLYVENPLAAREGDGLRAGEDPEAPGIRSDRGASYLSPAHLGRSANRNALTPEFRDMNLGVRPARSLDR